MNSIASPTQARSKKALERFLNVAAELLSDNQFEETGISQIAQLAESSVGTFYRLLGDKDVLLYAVHERFVEQSRTAVDALLADLARQPQPLEAQVEAFIRGVVRLFEGSEGLLRALIRRSSMDPQFRQRFHQLNAYIGQAFARIALAQRDKLRHPAPEQAADLGAHMLLSGLNYFTMVGSLGTTPREDIPGELSRMVCNYLQVTQS
ncbi:TetR/AcrR family transcriptional regulator [Pseudomonas sp. CAU 1711]|uniref:TetR/AcrR family transcriptional regulator n=1 Tax=Pseudomonas sp. CAU 1711 TaxID=3140356 RepID=UPI003260BD54